MIFADSNVALNEKAFIDLFFAITRNSYPMPLQELGRTYSNMIRLGAIDKKNDYNVIQKKSAL